jgi:V/A-type H+-transporting ATPase subunit C
MGRIRAVEGKMLGRAQLERMIEAKTAGEAARVLRESGYGRQSGEPELSGGEGAAGGGSGSGGDGGYERLLDEENGKLIGFLGEISPEPMLLNIFLRKNDYHNLKVLMKGELSGHPDDSLLSRSGLIPPQKLAACARERSFRDLPKAMADGYEEAARAYSKALDPQAIDIKLDRAAYAQMLAEAREFGNPFLLGLVVIYIDIANIGAFVRIKAMKKSRDFLRGALLEGGRLDRAVFERHLSDATVEGFVAALQFTPYGAICEEGLKAWQATGTITAFERLADDFALAYAGAARLRPAGPETIVAYLVAKQAELKNARIVLVGKTNAIPGDTIRERLRRSSV